ncbi:hypothetical protein DFH28DRAFT_940106 [Melampsora americana]|nr:hypothetical protein DFH28DRAFT_940106 [Melampsora americana]
MRSTCVAASLAALCCSIGRAEDVSPVSVDKPKFVPTSLKAHFFEHFTRDWSSRWSPSEATKETSTGGETFSYANMAALFAGAVAGSVEGFVTIESDQWQDRLKSLEKRPEVACEPACRQARLTPSRRQTFYSPRSDNKAKMKTKKKKNFPLVTNKQTNDRFFESIELLYPFSPSNLNLKIFCFDFKLQFVHLILAWTQETLAI